jgi:predicted alpha/beta hydrolase
MIGRAVKLALLAVGAASLTGKYEVSTTYLNITMSDGTVLNADVSLPTSTSSDELFPVLIFMNSWACPQIEYIIQAQHFASAGYVVLEYEARGWFHSGGLINTAGPKDQEDVSEIITYVLNQAAWQPDPSNVALAGISYGAVISLLGAARDERVKTAVAMSGLQDVLRALFENDSPALVWGNLLLQSGKILGREEASLQQMWDALIIGNRTALEEFSRERSAVTYKDVLEARQVPIFFSSNFEDRLFQPQDTLDFFTTYTGPKRLLLNQGIHATAEIGGLLLDPNNHVWVEVKKWLDKYLKGIDGPEWPLVDMQLRCDWSVHEEFGTWPSDRIMYETYFTTPRGSGWYGGLAKTAGSPSPAFETITFAKSTGISAGVPIVGELLQVYTDAPILSSLPTSLEAHSIWYNVDLSERTRFCGTPKLSLDFIPSHGKWQIVAYLFGVDWLTKTGTLVSHGSVTCWNCTAGDRQHRQIELRTMCEDLGKLGMSGIGLALNLYSDLYQPANTADDFNVALVYSDAFNLQMPAMEDSATHKVMMQSDKLV